MSTTSDPKSARRRRRDDDPFRLGWRFVKVRRPDGTTELEQVPLTLEDVLHPEEGDFHVLTDGHIRDCLYLRNVIQARLELRPGAVVLSDCRVAWDVPGLRPLGPDVAVFFNVGRHIDWGTFDVAQEGAEPVLVVEVTSPETRVNDVGVMVDYYFRAGVPLYLIADARKVRGGKRRLELIGYRAGRDRYRRWKPDRQCRLVVEPLGLSIGAVPDPNIGARLACFDGETGQEIGNYTEVCRALDEADARAREADARAREADARAEAEAEARRAMERRLDQMQDELRRLRGEG
jgi:Uma2 family endonuclease